MKVDVCFSPVLYTYYKGDDETIVIVVDIFRVTTCMCTALYNGAKSIIPVATPDEAKDYHGKGYLVGGEKDMKLFDFGTFGNSPSDYTKDKVLDQEIVISTTNGTHAIDMARDAGCLLIGSFSNLSTIVDFCIQQQKDVLVLCAGWQDKFNLEDSLFGGAIVEKLVEEGGYKANYDAASVAVSMWKEAQSDMMSYIKRSEHLKRLEQHGLLDVVEFCLKLDTVQILPVYNKETGKITVK